MSQWITILSLGSLFTGVVCAVGVVFDEWRRPQPMWIMNVVWPITALYSGPLGLAAYITFGRAAQSGDRCAQDAMRDRRQVTPATVAKGATHCGAGCTLGDIVSEILLAASPAIALFLGWRVLWQDKIFSAWILDFVFAYVIGIIFQYFSIKPMHPDMHRGEALKRALQADTLSLIAWQIGMYGVMAVAHFWLFPRLLGIELSSNSVAFWWMMQFAMMAGFLTTYPVNRWLLSVGIKEVM